MKHAPFIFCLRLLLRIGIIGVIAYGLYLNLYAGFGEFQSWLLLFYTTQSNALVMLVFIALCIHDIRSLRKNQNHHSYGASDITAERLQSVKTALTWAISITGIVWHFILVPLLEEELPAVTAQLGLVISPELLFSFALLHTWSPLLAFLDWLLFSPKGSIKRFTPFKWLLIPLAYFAFICFWVKFVGPVKPEYNFNYPYPFLDFDANGIANTWIGLAAILLGMLALGYLYFGLDKLFAKLTRSSRG